jgi:hypothetical protein
LQANRVRTGQMASDESYGLAGAFRVIAPGGALLAVISSGPECEFNDTEWEHVSVTAEGRCPTWDEMCFVKNLFWNEHEGAMQLHPPKSDYIDYHPHCLHIWRPIKMPIPMPPLILVGPRPRPGR